MSDGKVVTVIFSENKAEIQYQDAPPIVPLKGAGRLVITWNITQGLLYWGSKSSQSVKIAEYKVRNVHSS